jgi:Tetratricopeptide repeat
MGAGDRWRFRVDGVPRTVGRDHELAQLRELLSTPKDVSTVVLWGIGGVGKSWLAQTYALEHQDRLRLRWWINASSRLDVIADLAKLAKFLDISDEDQERAARNVLLRLGGLEDWLLVYDDADDPATLAGLLPTVGSGEVIVTSRHSGWRRFGEEIHVQPFGEQVAADYLSERTVGHDPEAAKRVAADLDGLPLALALAAAYCRQTRTPLDRYHRDYQRDRERLIADDDFAARDHPVPVVLGWRRCFAAAGRRHKGAHDLLRLLASFAQRPVPRGLLSAAPDALPRKLRRTVTSPDELGTAISALAAFGLVEAIGGSAVTVHRLMQDLTYALCPPDQLRKAAHGALYTLLWSFPADVSDRSNWPDCSTLFSHARTALTHADRYEVPGTADATLRTRVAGYLMERGEYAHARDLLAQAATSREMALGVDHPTTLLAGIDVARVDRHLGNAPAVHRRLTPTLRRCRRVFGPGHPETLATASHLADALQEMGDLNAARELGEEVLAWCRS